MGTMAPKKSEATRRGDPRSWLRPGLPLAAAIVLCLLPGAPSPAGDWPQFLGPTRDGVYAGDDLAESWGDSGPPISWKRSVGQGFSGPVVAGGKLILFHRLDDEKLGGRETVECLEAETGRKSWSFDYPTAYHDDFGFDEGPRATPAVSAGRVYAYGAEGRLHCLDLSSGKKLWSVDCRREFGARKGWFGIGCSPLVEENLVLLNVGGKEKSGIVAFEKDSGKVLWKATDDEASYSSPAMATIDGKRHAFFFTRSGLTDLDPENGTVRFQFPWRARADASVNAATPLVAGDLVFISASYQTGAALLKIKGSEVEKVWSSDDVLSNHYATSILYQGYLYGFDGRQEYRPRLRSVELKTGKVSWTKERFGAGTVTLAGDRLLILKESGDLLLAPATPGGFKVTAEAKVLPETVRAYPALASGRLYARSQDTLVCVDLRKTKG